ncbi:MAG: CapA family protein [Candidatus Shapirobacteria bacterium]|nr:CapA family protein [Candidatus Shapirobacteria bacterium]
MKSLAIKAVAGLLLVLVLFLAIFLIVRNPSFFDQRGVFGPIEEEAWRFEEDVGELAEKAKILFGGDLMFDRHIRFFAEEKGYEFVFADLEGLFSGYDLVVANLEGPITDNPSVSLGTVPGTPENFIFTFDPRVAPLLTNHNISVVCLGNNHILNFGQTGLEATRRYLSRAGVDFFGFAGDDENRTLVRKVGSLSFGFANYNQFQEGGLLAAQEDIASLKGRVDWLILYAHWGNEYQPQAGPAIEELARDFIDRGVDLIIGSHPHVIQQKEIYRDKIIYYSLGNFVFDQYFSPEVTRGLLVGLEIDRSTGVIDIREWPIIMLPGGQTTLD